MTGAFFKKRSLLEAGAVGLALAVLLTSLLCGVLAALIHRRLLPMSGAGTFAAGALGLAVFAAVLTVSRLRGRQAMPLAGIILAGVILLAAILRMLFAGGLAPGEWLFPLVLAAAAGGILGAFMSIGQNPYKNTRRIRR